MFAARSKDSPPWWLDVAFGAAAGALGTWAMAPTMKAIEGLQSPDDKERERDAEYEENAPTKAARKLAEPLGVQIDHPKAAGQVVHWAYGTSWGIAYALLTRRFGSIPLLSGVVLGVGLWAIGDELLVPALRLAPKLRAFPATTHVKSLGGHVAYGAGVDATHRLLTAASRQLLR
jgi:hypothetical protein